ncbi:ParB/RepB/Spo0J family partition protein [Ancylobacter sonchi]|uniref:ParB/RepB/Spo0J family partition protein n=1 Tax=Ancylobacter sonchi TaxID=1937790 RepID=UPI001BD49E01|nr:ParB/RepB/Spo0J family partition protein [Ancylobacter sonchi]MBS7532316.1 ParB/RepB/Spo0J family partition protein [Ancylobacter sonchi]
MNSETITTIPLNLLVQSERNVRRTGRKDAIDELVASIRTHGLRQGLNVLPTEDARYEVVAGGRRLRALKQLAKEKHLTRDFPVPCRVLTDNEDAGEISLAENVVRVAMHPADQFDAFHALVQKGHTTDEVAQRFGIDTGLVERRLKLASVAPKIFAAYRKGDINLDCLMAFTVNDDHEAQLRVWADRKRHHLTPQSVRRALTESTIPATHKLARFVGLQAYTEAGGAVMRDLFDERNEGYLTDSALLMQLASRKLSAGEQEVAAEGWKWVRSELEDDHSIRYGRVYPEMPQGEGEDTDAEQYGEEEAEACDAEFGEDEEDEQDDSEAVYAPEDRAKAGALLRIDWDGDLSVTRGLVHPDDMEQHERQAKPHTAKPDAAKGEYAATITEDLTAHKTAALRHELLHNPHVALAVAVHAMALRLFYSVTAGDSCSNLRIEETNLKRLVKSQEDCSAHAALAEQKERWAEFLPVSGAELFDWCLAQEDYRLMDLLAYCTAMSVSAVRGKQEGSFGRDRIAHSEQVARALELDMTKHWEGTAEGFYGHIPKKALIHAVAESRAPISVSVSDLKKHEAARYVAKAMGGTGWLPLALRPALPCPVEPLLDEATDADVENAAEHAA